MITLLQEKFGEIGAVLAGDTANERGFHGWHASTLGKAPRNRTRNRIRPSPANAQRQLTQDHLPLSHPVLGSGFLRWLRERRPLSARCFSLVLEYLTVQRASRSFWAAKVRGHRRETHPRRELQ